MKTRREKNARRATIALIALIVAELAALTILTSLYFAGAFTKAAPMLCSRDADGGFEKRYVVGGTYPGTYAFITINDGERDYRLETLLLEEYAPLTVANFKRYVDCGFYVGTAFHRIVVENSTFQGGGFTYSDGEYEAKPSPFAPIKGEFRENGEEYARNKLSHFAGTISMARTSDMDSATGGFFFSWDDAPGWDGKYAAFGFLVEREDIETIRRLGESAELNEDAGKEERPLNPITITKAEIREVRNESQYRRK